MREATESYVQETAKRPPTIENRTAVRYLTKNDTFAFTAGQAHNVNLVAKVHDISRHGIGLILNERVGAGTILNIELHSKSQRLPLFLLARVIWTGERTDGTLMAGCQFSRALSEQELVALL